MLKAQLEKLRCLRCSMRNTYMCYEVQHFKAALDNEALKRRCILQACAPYGLRKLMPGAFCLVITILPCIFANVM